MRTIAKFALMASVFGLVAFAPSARAALIFSLNQDGCTGSCGTPPFATVTLTQTTATTVTVTEVLKAGEGFVATGAGDALEFNISGNPAIVIGNLTTGFAVGPAPDTVSTFGTFDYSVSCTGCGNGGSDPNPGPLSFTVMLANSAPLSINNFVSNSGGYFFASDIMGANGKTGNVAAIGTPSNVPEPVSLALVGAGLLGLGIFRRRVSA